MVPRSLYLLVTALAAVAVFVGVHSTDVEAQTPTPSATPTVTSTPGLPTSTPTPTETAPATSTPNATATSTATATATATAAPAPAECPSGVTIMVAAPTAASPSTVSVKVTPSLNIKSPAAGDPTSFHVHYFIDTPGTTAGERVPMGNPNIIHSAALTQDIGTLSPGTHTVTVVLGQVNHTACDARGSVTFTVTGAAAPRPPSTGSAGLATDEAETLAVFALLGLGLALTAGARLTARRTR